MGAVGQNLSYGQFLQNCLVFYGIYFLWIFLYTDFPYMAKVYWQDYAKQNYYLILMDIMCWRAYLIIKFNLPEMGARIIFPMTTNVLTSCLHIPGYPADHGTLWMMNTNITETSTVLPSFGRGVLLILCMFRCSILELVDANGQLLQWRKVQVYLSVFGLCFQPSAWKHLEGTDMVERMLSCSLCLFPGVQLNREKLGDSL